MVYNGIKIKQGERMSGKTTTNQEIIKLHLLDRCVDDLANRLNVYLKTEDLEYEKLKLGLYVLLLNLPKVILTMIFAAYFNIMLEAAIMILSHNWLRHTSFGEHASNPTVCLIVTLIMFILPPVLLKNIYCDNYIVIIVFLIFNMLFYKYAPADTEKHPLLGEEYRKKLKMRTLVRSTILMTATLLLPYKNLKTLVLVSGVYAVVGILPITYKVLKRRYNNYEGYEKNSC